MAQMHNPPHPGRVLKDAIEGANISVAAFAAHLGVSRQTITRIISGSAGITAEMSIKLSEAFDQGGDHGVWFRMQNSYDLWQAQQVKRKKVKPLKVAA